MNETVNKRAFKITMSVSSLLIVCSASLIKGIEPIHLESKIVGGEPTDIRRFPHSAFLVILCDKGAQKHKWACGASILNQLFLITAAHCLEECLASSYISVTVGTEDKNGTAYTTAHSFVSHPDYNSTKKMHNDIALIRVKKSFRFSSKVKRVSLMKDPPYKEVAHVAGWGLNDETLKNKTRYLKMARQVIITQKECRKHFNIADGFICATNPEGYAAKGDSGSALVVRDYIQVGIVSYKKPAIPNIIVYTDISHHYDWIQKTTHKMYCT